jgi:hypothetical protein
MVGQQRSGGHRWIMRFTMCVCDKYYACLWVDLCASWWWTIHVIKMNNLCHVIFSNVWILFVFSNHSDMRFIHMFANLKYIICWTTFRGEVMYFTSMWLLTTNRVDVKKNEKEQKHVMYNASYDVNYTSLDDPLRYRANGIIKSQFEP